MAPLTPWIRSAHRSGTESVGLVFQMNASGISARFGDPRVNLLARCQCGRRDAVMFTQQNIPCTSYIRHCLETESKIVEFQDTVRTVPRVSMNDGLWWVGTSMLGRLEDRPSQCMSFNKCPKFCVHTWCSTLICYENGNLSLSVLSTNAGPVGDATAFGWQKDFITTFLTSLHWLFVACDVDSLYVLEERSPQNYYVHQLAQKPGTPLDLVIGQLTLVPEQSVILYQFSHSSRVTCFAASKGVCLIVFDNGHMEVFGSLTAWIKATCVGTTCLVRTDACLILLKSHLGRVFQQPVEPLAIRSVACGASHALLLAGPGCIFSFGYGGCALSIALRVRWLGEWMCLQPVRVRCVGGAEPRPDLEARGSWAIRPCAPWPHLPWWRPWTALLCSRWPVAVCTR